MTEEQTQQTQRTQPANAPQVIAGRYALLGEIGRGGMGVVWRAEDRVIGRHVAIKSLHLPGGAEDVGVFQERVLREVRTGGKLNDPAVVTVYDVIHEGDTTYIVMELVEAPTLSDLVRQHGPLPPARVAAIGEQVLSALQAAHAAGIVHRDVKPGNIMVAPNGRVKLTDFGIAQAVDDPRLTTSGMIVGSPAFMAPERVEGREAMPESDLWSLGATLFFAVEGLVAFERPTTAATLHAIMNEVPYLTRGQGPLASAIMGLLISSPEARITATQARGLLSMASSGTGQATPPGGQTALYTGQAPVHYAPPATRANRGKRTALAIGAAVVAVALLVAGLFVGKWIFSPEADSAMLPTLTYGDGGDIRAFNWSSSSSSDGCVNVKLEAQAVPTKDNWVDCKELHYAELFDQAEPVKLESSSSSDKPLAAYPGLDVLKRFGEARCASSFNTNRITPGERPNLRYRALVPTENEWKKAPASSSDSLERTVHCFVERTGGAASQGSVKHEIK
ncbi:serine/threonine-protein kinase [Amycolatopsis anabasis]|uniref:serine/threonine-protein kinase n=1 Tax=Amycolatopsis anabasis TaxID=1840409 RepID=UPI00131DCD0D|nr:serine/threonine-protein kinase [Amycolatopsis anabasis]